MKTEIRFKVVLATLAYAAMGLVLLLMIEDAQAWEYQLPEFSPAECRAHGVLVPEKVTIQGLPVVVSIGSDLRPKPTAWHADLVPLYCPETCLPHDGCAEYLGEHNGIYQWKIYYSSRYGYVHAKCHAEFQVLAHTLPNS